MKKFKLEWSDEKEVWRVYIGRENKNRKTYTAVAEYKTIEEAVQTIEIIAKNPLKLSKNEN